VIADGTDDEVRRAECVSIGLSCTFLIKAQFTVFASFQSQNYRAGKQDLLCKLAFNSCRNASSGLNTNTSLKPSEFMFGATTNCSWTFD